MRGLNDVSLKNAGIILLLAFLALPTGAMSGENGNPSKLLPRPTHGDAESQSQIRPLQSKEDGADKNEAEAFEWIKAVAELGVADAQAYVGEAYATGRWVKRDHIEAVKWLKRAAEQGNAPSAYTLGLFYKLGLGVPRNYEESARWYLASAEGGYAKAQFYLAIMYMVGKDVEPSLEEARKWMRKAAEQNKPKGSNQTLAVALAQRDAALREKKEASLQAKVFKEAKDSEQQACIDLAAQTKTLEEIGSKRKGLERARRVIPILRKIDQVVIGIDTIGAVPFIAGDIVQEFPQAVQRRDEAKTAANVAANEFDMAQQESTSIVVDTAILERKDEIQIILGDLRSRFNTAESDIPRRTAELKVQETIILNKRKDISLSNLTTENVGDLLPKRTQINTLRRLATERKRHDEAINTAQASLKKTEANLSKAQQEAAGFGKIYDLSELKLALGVALDDSGLETRIKQTEERVASLRSQTDIGVSRLVPGKPNDVKRVNLPSLSTITRFSEE